MGSLGWVVPLVVGWVLGVLAVLMFVGSTRTRVRRLPPRLPIHDAGTGTPPGAGTFRYEEAPTDER